MFEHILTWVVILALVGLVVHLALDGLSIVVYVFTIVGGLIWLAMSYVYSLIIKFLFPRKWQEMQKRNSKDNFINPDDWTDECDEYVDGEAGL